MFFTFNFISSSPVVGRVFLYFILRGGFYLYALLLFGGMELGVGVGVGVGVWEMIDDGVSRFFFFLFHFFLQGLFSLYNL